MGTRATRDASQEVPDKRRIAIGIDARRSGEVRDGVRGTGRGSPVH